MRQLLLLVNWNDIVIYYFSLMFYQIFYLYCSIAANFDFIYSLQLGQIHQLYCIYQVYTLLAFKVLPWSCHQEWCVWAGDLLTKCWHFAAHCWRSEIPLVSRACHAYRSESGLSVSAFSTIGKVLESCEAQACSCKRGCPRVFRPSFYDFIIRLLHLLSSSLAQSTLQVASSWKSYPGAEPWWSPHYLSSCRVCTKILNGVTPTFLA